VTVSTRNLFGGERTSTQMQQEWRAKMRNRGLLHLVSKCRMERRIAGFKGVQKNKPGGTKRGISR